MWTVSLYPQSNQQFAHSDANNCDRSERGNGNDSGEFGDCGESLKSVICRILLQK